MSSPRLVRQPGLRLENLEMRLNLSPPTVVTVVPNGSTFGGAVQRSLVYTIDVKFSESIVLPASPANAFELIRTTATGEQPGVTGLVNIAAVQNNDSVILTFLPNGPNPVNAIFESLPDGNYTLKVLANQVSGTMGQLDGNGDGFGGDDYLLVGSKNSTPKLFRLFGDGDGNGIVNQVDFTAFRAILGGSNPTFDYDLAGGVTTLDFLQFRMRFGSSLP